MKLLASALISAILLTPHAAAADTSKDNATAALKVLERTKTTGATYSLYLWNRVAPARQPSFEEWSAEFHKGNFHRVETPRDRLIADCSKLTGTALSVTTGKTIEGPSVAAAACGINTNASILSVELRGMISTKFGSTQRVRVTDTQNVREYDVTDDGILLQSTYRDRADGRLLITGSAIDVKRDVPSPDMFSRESLARSFVPAEYRAPPQQRSIER